MADSTNRTRAASTGAGDSAADTRPGSKKLVVLAPLVATKDEAGRILYLYRGTPMPERTPQAEIDRLSEMGMIGEDDGTAIPGVAQDPRA
jgi:hypothetical protein